MGLRKCQLHVRCLSAAAMGLTLAASALAPARADQILFWNQEIETLEAMSPAPTPMASGRDLSMLNVAML